MKTIFLKKGELAPKVNGEDVEYRLVETVSDEEIDKERITLILMSAIPSWNPENFADLLGLLESQYPHLLPSIKSNLDIK